MLKNSNDSVQDGDLTMSCLSLATDRTADKQLAANKVKKLMAKGKQERIPSCSVRTLQGLYSSSVGQGMAWRIKPLFPVKGSLLWLRSR